jgi:imidazolonepropionase-like amidohydrolase/Tol biopolymer transport system component
MLALRLRILLVGLVLPPVVDSACTRDEGLSTIEFETTEVTAPDVALSPDGEWLIFTMLGHLFRLPAEGGLAEQLTFGPYHDTDPAFSPDGSRVAFGSNRDGSDGNVFVLDLADGDIVQLTRDSMAGRPAWAPDGSAIAYLRLRTRSYHCPSGRAGVARVALEGGEPEHVVGGDDAISSVFYMPDGRLAWAAIGLEPHGFITRIDALIAPDSVETLDTLDGAMGRVLVDAAGSGFYGRGHPRGPFEILAVEQLVFWGFTRDEERPIATLAFMPACDFLVTPSIAIAPTGDAVYLGEAGRLWKYSVQGGVREPIPFRAKVTLEVREPTASRTITFPAPGASKAPRAITHPGLSPDNENVVFGAADHIWRQPTDGGPAQRLVDGRGHEREPVLSPDGQRLLFISSEAWEQQVRMLDLETREIQTLAAGPYYWDVAWSRDGQRVVFGGFDRSTSRPQLMVVDLAEGTTDQFAVPGLERLSRPQFSADGEWLYFSAKIGAMLSLYRLPLDGEPEPQEFITLDRHLIDPLLTPDGHWLAFRRNTEIWLARLDQEERIGDKQIRRVSRKGGANFSFTPDGTALLYAAGGRVWRQAIENGEREEIPIGLRLRVPSPSPLLVRRVRVLDFTTGGFGTETSMYLEGGRIRWMGAEREHELPAGVVILDGGGRFAVPGFFDMHVHATADAYFRSGFQEAWLAYGVTSVREAGNDLAFSATLADRSEATADPVPRYFFSGDVFHGEFGPLPWETFPVAQSFVLSDEADVHSYVRQWSKRGAHFIKTHPSLSWPLQRALVDEARRLGLPVMEHGNWHESLLRSVTLGSSFVEHFDSYFDDVLQLLAAARTEWSPTLTLSIADVALLEPERIENAKLRAFAMEGLLEHQQDHFGEVDAVLWRDRRSTQLSVIGAAYRRGVRLYAGTDAPYGPVPGASLHRELRSFVDADIPALQVLRIATQHAAEAVGAGDDLGTLEAGKLADIVLLDANPLDDIRNTQTIWRVIKGGWVFDPEEMAEEARRVREN